MAILLSIVCVFQEANFSITTKANGQYAFVMLYNIVYGFTWYVVPLFHWGYVLIYRRGPIPWLVPAEIFPLRGRSKGMALATAR